MADPELSKAFAEHQSKVIDLTQRIKVAQGQIELLKVTMAKAQLTNNEISSLPDSTRTYESIGRMFLLQPASIVKKHLSEQKQEAIEKIKTQEVNIKHWEQAIKSSEESVRELVLLKRKEL